MKKSLSCLSLVLALIVASCNKHVDQNANPDPEPPVVTGDSAIAPIGFDFNTTKTVSLNIQLATNNDEAITGVPVRFYAGDPMTTSPVYMALTDMDGKITGSVSLPQYVDTLTIDPQYVGLMRYAKTIITGNDVTATIGGQNDHSSNIIESNFMMAEPRIKSLNNTSGVIGGSTIYSYMGKYNSDGVPDYLEPKRDAINAQLLSFINNSLPEGRPVPTYHPTYLAAGNVTSLNVTAMADIWVTFVSEGAGYLNSIGYYTYPTGQAPQSVSDLDSIHYMFPNASLPNSGGNLSSGSKVKLGRFPAGTSIGFVLLANSWNGNGVNSNAPKYFSDPILNPETSSGLQQHTVLLYDEPQSLYLIGFEDVNRQTGGSDNDFNDAVFYATSNPVTAISNDKVQPVDEPGDADKDGITDRFDEFPTDPARAFTNYYPSATTYGTLAFEDLWPTTGDYDMNDLVVNYRYKYITNGTGKVVELFGDYSVKAAGATFLNGFGVQFPFSPDVVSKVTGQKFVSKYINQSANGTEAAQSKAVIIPFDNYEALVTRPGGFEVNTQFPAPVVKSDTAHVYIGFAKPLDLSTFGTAPFNPFIISNLLRGYEVHLPGGLPTDLANAKLFNTAQDYTHPSQNYYYKTRDAWPWGLSFAESFDYPAEGAPVNKTYTHFLQWAQSGGTKYKDWYKDLSGYRNTSMIYHK